ncbi:MAG: hypothetical protein IJO08_01505 [Clostridia bacterium]|nr:hypothetical protein [Clostridia bacterium]
MKKIMLLVCIISVLVLTACGPKDKTNENNLPDNQSGENISNDDSGSEVIINDDSEIFKMSFEERTKPYFNKKEATSGDRMLKDFNVVKLTKVDNHYELRASMIGDARIGIKALEMGMNQIADQTVPEIDLELENGDIVTLYSIRPEEIIEQYKVIDAKRRWDRDPFDIPAFDDDDWAATRNKKKWMNSDGLPMYAYFDGMYGEGWARLEYVEEQGYYLKARNVASKTEAWYFQSTNEIDTLCIKLLPSDKIVLDIYDALGVSDEILYENVSGDFSGDISGDGSGEAIKVYEPKTLTVEEYYNLSINNGYEYRTEDGYFINITNMSDDNIGDIGLEINDGEIHVIAKYVGP